MKTVNYTVRELKNLIRESANEFNAKLGPNVRNANKENSEKSYRQMANRADDYEGGLLKAPKKNFPPREDYNKTMLHLHPRTEVDKDTKERYKAQAEGFSSELEKKNGSNKNGTFEGNKKFLKDLEDNRDKMDKEKEELAKSGLQGSKLSDEHFKKNNLTENKLQPKRLTFKKKFINEANMLQRIPSEYIKDGQVIYMTDRFDNEYIVECTKSEKSGIVETNVVGYNNKTKLNEQLDRMYSLFDFNEDDGQRLTNKERVDESETFEELMNLARGK